MKLKIIILLIIAGLGMTSTLSAQKIAYANIELIVAYMPESTTMQQKLDAYQKELSQKLQVKEQYALAKMIEYQNLAQAGQDEARLKPRENELVKLEQEIRKEANEADIKLSAKRVELMNPITEKLKKAIVAVSDAEGYEYVLNSVDGSGMSIVVHGPEEHDITEKIMTRLGIQIPDN